MPYKKGPHGTQRKFSRSNGRYCKETMAEIIVRYNNMLEENKRPLSKSEKKDKKERNRREQLRIQAINSKDPLLYDIFIELEKICPGCVTHVNKKLYNKDGTLHTELDIVTNKQIIEIKSGQTIKEEQCEKQLEIAKALNKTYVCYSPKYTNYDLKKYKRYNITNKLHDIIERETKKK